MSQETLTKQETTVVEKNISSEFQTTQALLDKFFNLTEGVSKDVISDDEDTTIDASRLTDETIAKITETQENVISNDVAIADDSILPDFEGNTDLSVEELEELYNLSITLSSNT